MKIAWRTRGLEIGIQSPKEEAGSEVRPPLCVDNVGGPHQRVPSVPAVAQGTSAGGSKARACTSGKRKEKGCSGPTGALPPHLYSLYNHELLEFFTARLIIYLWSFIPIYKCLSPLESRLW